MPPIHFVDSLTIEGILNQTKKLSLLFSLLLLVSCSKEEPAPPAPTKYNVTVSLNPTDGGTVSPNGGQFNEGQTVSFTVTPSTNYVFKNWSGSDTSSNNPLSIIVNSNKTLVAILEKKDTDGDGVTDDLDQCPDTPSGEEVNNTGCSSSQIDTDADGVTDDLDQCPDTPNGEEVDDSGCSSSQIDTDGDGVTDDIDIDNSTRAGVPVDENGVMLNPVYRAENGVTIKAQEWGIAGDIGIIDDVEYTIVDNTIHELDIETTDFSKLVTSLVTTMNGLFEDIESFNQDISTWDVSNVTDMSYMFFINTANKGVFNRDISKWDVSSVNSMAFMFANTAFNQDISSWDIRNVTSLRSMFYKSNFNQDISNWDVSNVSNMQSMFWDSPFNQDIGSWDVSNVTRMSFMFARTPFNQDISSWDVSKVESMNVMFFETPFNQDISNWDVSSVGGMGQMFDGSSFNQDISNWDVSNVTIMLSMFRNTTFNQDLSNWDVLNVTDCEFFSANNNVWTLPKPNFTNCDPN